MFPFDDNVDPVQAGYMEGMAQAGYMQGMMAGGMDAGVMAGGMPYQQQFGGMGGYPPMSGMPYGGYSQPMGRVDAMGYVKYSRQQMLDGLRNFVVMQTHMPISKEEKIPETPALLRHACAQCGISQLQMLQFNIPESGITIPFYFCTACGKLFYYKDFAI